MIDRARAKVTAQLRFTAGNTQYALVVGLALIDLVILTQWFAATLGTLPAIAVHNAVTIGLCAVASRAGKRWSVDPLGLALLLLLLGPLGGIAVFLGDASAQVLGQVGAWFPKIAAQPKREALPLTPAEKVYAQIRQGRRPEVSAAVPRSYDTIFSTGTLADQQAAIAAISRAYQPAMYGPLQMALASKVPVVRVQAAAVFAKLRGDFGRRAKALIEPAPPASQAELLHVARSGFLEPELADRLIALAGDAEPQPPQNATARAAPRQDVQAPPQLKRYSCGGMA
ncbi:hypothetical protein [Pseudogemmobacter sp. W21_MBD1_M6]|uniref:hypothetical protein n=1 Tax=Pseudogemmobacter sp. W21_MBD1_M6 TaxID=3240271 RepID=UPI003F956A87